MNSFVKSVEAVSHSPDASQGHDPMVFTDIYKNNCNIVIWNRSLPKTLEQDVNEYLKLQSGLQASMILSPDNATSVIHKALGGKDITARLSENIADLVDVFCYLFELDRVGLRLTALDSAMCPRFHVDKVPARLVTTFQGSGTQWLPHKGIDRSKLGHASQGKSDDASGLYQSSKSIQQLNSGDVALLKGEGWQGNEGAGLVHRSPVLPAGEKRLLLTLDFN